MNVINFTNKIKDKSLENFINWLSSDFVLVNNIILKHLTNSTHLVSELSNHIISSGGKRIRPLLTLACSKLCNYSGSRHVRLASVIEFIHTATLLHDDVVDNSKRRRGKKTANFVWGNKSSILVGDYLLSQAFRLLIKDGSLKCLDIISKTSLKISQGEVKQLISVNNLQTSESEYLDIITYKTAELFSAACQISGEISEVSDEKKSALGEFGKFVGTAFQIIDDTLDYFSEEKFSGKDLGNDLKEGKITLPLILCFKRSNKTEKKLLEYMVNKNQITKNDLSKTINLMNKYDVKEDCIKKAQHFSIMSKDSLGIFPQSPEKEKILDLVDILISRKN